MKNKPLFDFTEKYKNRIPESIYEESDPEPVEIPCEMKRPLTMEEKIKRIIATEFSQKMESQGMESYEDSEDFEVDEPFDADLPLSQYEIREMDPEFPEGIEDRSPLPKEQEQGDTKNPPDSDNEPPEDKIEDSGPEEPDQNNS